MGHCEENIAREGFREVMMLYRASGGVGAGEAIHRLAHLICSAVSPIKEEREAWLRGVPRSQLPRILGFCSKMRFLSTSERAIEAKHAITTRNLKRTTNLSEAGVAFELRGTELGRRLDKSDNMLVSLVEIVETLRGDPENMLAELGLFHHPKVVQIRKKKKDISRREAAKIIDHCLRLGVEVYKVGRSQTHDGDAQTGSCSPGQTLARPIANCCRPRETRSHRNT